MIRDASESLSSVAERQMRGWELSFDVQNRLARDEASGQLSTRIHPYIAIAREAGAGGSSVAEAVAEELGTELMDRELLDYMAERFNLSRGMLRFVDEQARNWLTEVFGHWLDSQLVPQTTYVSHLGQIVLMSARSHAVTFVGRGAHFFLPREKGLLILFIAPEDLRIERAMRKLGGSRDEARKYVESRDRGRREFVRYYFHRDVTDPHLYDLVINTHNIGLDEARSIVVREYRRRFKA